MQVHTGICRGIGCRSGNTQVCDASYDGEACNTGYCLGSNGRELGGSGMGFCTQLVQPQREAGVCDLSYGSGACGNGFYCQDSMRASNGASGGGVGGGAGAVGYGVVISGPSGQIVSGNAGNVAANGRNGISTRSFGTGMCVRSIGGGGRCGNNDECGGSTCNGLGASTATGGVIAGSSGTIVWGTGGATSGTCG
mmetsp:Transcript_12251/g.21495  ORF Transcript_12251/g.21495 Transcript_12251/m.21495 type:complete len:195 (+) Transcript_12251:1704-2288(+)